MKYRQSGMPEEAFWETLFDVSLILDRLGIDSSLSEVVELGCGYGTFTVPVARRISGMLRTFDIDRDMVDRTRLRLNHSDVRNATVELRDVVVESFGVEPSSQDAVLLFNILHGEDPIGLLREARTLLNDHGRALVIHWRFDPATPRGPSMEIRPRPEQCVEWAMTAGFKTGSTKPIDLPPYHWGLVLHV